MKIKSLLLFALFLPIFVMGQKIKVLQGTPSSLANETSFDAKVTLNGTKFYKENISETEYIKRRTEEITKDKGAAEAEKWESHWEETKTVNMPEKFVQAINKKGKKGVTFSQDSGSKYTAIINVDWVYPGWFAAAMKQPSKMNATITFVESANPDKVVLKLNCVNAIGDMYPMGIPNNNNRIAQALDMVGVGLGKFMKKKFK